MDKKAIRELKEEYLLTYEFYEGNRDLLKDLTTRSLYESLMKISSVDDLNRWIAAIRKTKICFEVDFSLACVYTENLLSMIEIYAADMTDEDKELAVAGFVKIRSNNFEHCSKSDIDSLMKDYNRKHSRKENDNIVVIFRDPYGDYIVVDKDADAIFEKTGWQTDVLEWQGRKYSFMFLNEAQVKVLSRSKVFSVYTTKAVVSDVSYINSVEQLFCEAQQKILAFMYTFEKRAIIPVLFVQRSDEDGVDTMTKYISMEIDRLSLTLYDTNGKTYKVVDNFSWPVNSSDYVLVKDISEFFDTLQYDKEQNLPDNPLSQKFDHSARRNGRLSYMEYNNMKEALDYHLIIMKHSSLYISYDGDAVALADKYRIPLWFRWIGDEKVVMAIIPEHLVEDNYFEDDELLEDDDFVTDGDLLDSDIIICDSSLQDPLEKMRITPCFLSDGTQFEYDYHDACVFKRKDGSYAVRAYCSCAEMPCTTVSKEKAEYYLSLSDYFLKNACIKAILYEAYHCKKEKQ